MSPIKKPISETDSVSVTLDADYHSPKKRSTLRRYVYIKEVLQRNEEWDRIGMPVMPRLPIPPEEKNCVKPRPRKKAKNAVNLKDVPETKVHKSGKCQSIPSMKRKSNGHKPILNGERGENSTMVNGVNASIESNEPNESNESPQPNEYDEAFASVQSDESVESFLSADLAESPQVSPRQSSYFSNSVGTSDSIVSQTSDQRKQSFSNIFSSFLGSLKSIFQHPSTVFNKHSILLFIKSIASVVRLDRS